MTSACCWYSVWVSMRCKGSESRRDGQRRVKCDWFSRQRRLCTFDLSQRRLPVVTEGKGTCPCHRWCNVAEPRLDLTVIMRIMLRSQSRLPAINIPRTVSPSRSRALGVIRGRQSDDFMTGEVSAFHLCDGRRTEGGDPAAVVCCEIEGSKRLSRKGSPKITVGWTVFRGRFAINIIVNRRRQLKSEAWRICRSWFHCHTNVLKTVVWIAQGRPSSQTGESRKLAQRSKWRRTQE